MKTKMDSRNRIYVPMKIRKQIGMVKGSKKVWKVKNGNVIIKVIPPKV